MRDRLQVDLTAGNRRLLQTLGERLGSSGDAETTRRVFEVVESLIERLQQGFRIGIISLIEAISKSIRKRRICLQLFYSALALGKASCMYRVTSSRGGACQDEPSEKSALFT